MDEASAPLDSFEREVLYSILRKLRDEGKGIIYITHHLEEMFQIGDKITVLRNGVKVATVNASEIKKSKLIDLMTGNKKLYVRENASIKLNSKRNSQVPVIEYSEVSNRLISCISFKAYKGETIGFAGIDGSMKEVIAETAYGLKRYQNGKILYKGKSLKVRHPVDAIRQGIGLVPTDRMRLGLIANRSIMENVSLPLINKIKKKVISTKWMSSLAKESIAKLDIKALSPSQLVEYLSGGNQQKVLVGKWLHAQSELLFLIEPTEGIDIGARADLYRLLKELSKEAKTIIIFSSDLDELLTLCDRIFTMVQGSISNEYDANDVAKKQLLSDILHHPRKGEKTWEK